MNKKITRNEDNYKHLMKYILTALFALSSILCFCQKRYEFDYLIEYKHTFYNDSLTEKTITRYYFTNSKKNNYLAIITDLDSLKYHMNFKDENGLTFKVNFLKSDLNKAEFINVECDYISKYHNPYKFCHSGASLTKSIELESW